MSWVAVAMEVDKNGRDYLFGVYGPFDDRQHAEQWKRDQPSTPEVNLELCRLFNPGDYAEDVS